MPDSRDNTELEVIDQTETLVLPVLNVQRNSPLLDKFNPMEDCVSKGCTQAYILSPGGWERHAVGVHVVHLLNVFSIPFVYISY